MRGIAEVTVIVALVGIVAAFTLMSLVTVADAMIAVRFTTFGTEDSLVANDWDLCEGFASASCG